MVGFAVVGLGMGQNRSRLIHATDGAKLKVVVDLDRTRLEKVSSELGVAAVAAGPRRPESAMLLQLSLLP